LIWRFNISLNLKDWGVCVEKKFSLGKFSTISSLIFSLSASWIGILGIIVFLPEELIIFLNKFKNKLQSTQTNIERIFLREEEKTFSNPNINIYIGSYDNEENINRKSNIHRARLSKFKKSKLNGEMIFQDDEQRIYKFNNGKKVYI